MGLIERHRSPIGRVTHTMSCRALPRPPVRERRLNGERNEIRRNPVAHASWAARVSPRETLAARTPDRFSPVQPLAKRLAASGTKTATISTAQPSALTAYQPAEWASTTPA